MLRVLVLILCLLPPPGWAGAWLRDKGQGFSAATLNVNRTDAGLSHYAGTYVEYGLTTRITLGVDAGRGVSGDSKTIAFLRRPLRAPKGNHRFAVELGLGEIAGQPVLRPGLSYGLGFDGRFGSGWLSVDTVAEWHARSGRVDVKADLTLGLSPTPKLKAMMQLQTGKSMTEPAFLRLVPSVAYRLGERWHLEAGLSHTVIGDRETGMKFGLWCDF
ncbi:hypothetical protein [Thalassovita taeanensis]|uniref:Uncharacterized protein n=1 Tax=Thalassovita taeanensis TaxID=657014 RepID=A0A1H9AN66_9RHOB|nr:hypothetical protein [Thalassovita taeanensis]SEP77813.1 hypothetical protein SAMN04488092_102190 [Thalassovita taeanensis]